VPSRLLAGTGEIERRRLTKTQFIICDSPAVELS
jgi:hypothetical protein